MAGIVAVLAVGGCGRSGSGPSAAPIATTAPAPTGTAVPATVVTTPVPSTTTSVGTGQPVIVDDCGGGAYKPTTLFIICGQAKLTATEIKWSSWTAEQAEGTAIMSVIVCQPSCSQGHEELLAAKLTLTNPKPSSRGLEFSSVTIAWSSTSPDGRPVDTYPLRTS
jgi:hypothetical protein